MLFVRHEPGVLKVFDLDLLNLNHRKKSAFGRNLVVTSGCFLYSLVVASSYLLFSKTDLQKSYLISKGGIILVIGVILWSTFAYKFVSSITSINKSLDELISKLKSKET